VLRTSIRTEREPARTSEPIVTPPIAEDVSHVFCRPYPEHGHRPGRATRRSGAGRSWPDPTDRRVVWFTLTPAGQAKQGEWELAHRRPLAAALTELDTAHLAAVRSALARL
jgi:hypothetical protein